jgi:UDP-galactopyranose mutase
LIVDRRPHIAGNCYDSQHANGVLIHNYGPHYFRTNHDNVLDYLSNFTDWIPANYEVRSVVRGRQFSFPINITTLESFFGKQLDPDAAERLLAERRLSIPAPRNSEEYVLSRVGRELYEAFYLNYTKKQWGVHPRDLSPEVCGRIPVRLDRDRRYVGHKHQVMPADGFTTLFDRMTRHRNIRVLLDCPFRDVSELITPRRATLYSGPIDTYFEHCFGKLPYRSLNFDFVPHQTSYLQPCVQINYPNDHDYTRSVEIKHVTGQRHPATVVSYETPVASGEPFYPVPRPESAALYRRYQELAERETARRRVYFCGRLAQYRYFNTDEVVQEALTCFQRIRTECGPRASASSATTSAA